MTTTAFGTAAWTGAWCALGLAFLAGSWGAAVACVGVLGVLASTRRQLLPATTSVERTVKGPAAQGAVLQVTVTARAPVQGILDVDAPVPIGFTRIRESRIAERGRVSLVQDLQAVAVGEVVWPPVRLLATDAWGLYAQPGEAAAPTPLTILPDAEWALRGRRLGLSNPVQTTMKAPAASERSLEIERIRAYAHGDAMRDIDWKATSRYQQLQVRERERHIPRPVTVVVDCGSSMRVQRQDLKLLSAVRVAHGVLAAAAGAGTTSHLVSVHDRRCARVAVSGLRDANAALAEVLASAPPLRPAESARDAPPKAAVLEAVGPSPGLLVLILDGETDPGWVVDLLPLLKRRGTLALVVPATGSHLYRRPEADRRVLRSLRGWRANRRVVQEAAQALRVPCWILRPGGEEAVLGRVARMLA